MRTGVLALFLTVAAVAAVAVSAAPSTHGQVFSGTISDDLCAKADHSQMQMGSNDAECAAACISAHGAAYVLYDGKTVYKLSGRPTAERFAGKKVRLTGALDAKTHTIRVESMTLAK
jgi:hypothetical protein